MSVDRDDPDIFDGEAEDNDPEVIAGLERLRELRRLEALRKETLQAVPPVQEEAVAAYVEKLMSGSIEIQKLPEGG